MAATHAIHNPPPETFHNPMHLFMTAGPPWLPTLYPVHAASPARITCIALTDAGATVDRVRRLAGTEIPVDCLRLDTPDGLRLLDCALRDAKERREAPLLNVSGGPRCLACQAAVIANALDVPAFCYDTTLERVQDLGLRPLDADLRRQLTPVGKEPLQLLLALHGHGCLLESTPWAAFLGLAHEVQDAVLAPHLLEQCLHGPRGLCPNGRLPQSPDEWLDCISKPLLIPPVLGARAKQVGLLREAPDGAFYLPDTQKEELASLVLSNPDPHGFWEERLRNATTALSRMLAILSGSWIEILAADGMARSGLFQDILWMPAWNDGRPLPRLPSVLARHGAIMVCIHAAPKPPRLDSAQLGRWRTADLRLCGPSSISWTCLPRQPTLNPHVRALAQECGMHWLEAPCLDDPDSWTLGLDEALGTLID